ncbi:MAG: hypothetical protein EU536_03270 [Promethearchaeota archaeon]|nr:MAG: hypothetical protein EU536_03270 [Candidatus Lokiarchaeota archaeon]
MKFFRFFTRYERFFMRLMFKLLKTDILYKNSLTRFIPEFIAYFAANGVQPTIYTLPELERIIEIIYKNNGGSQNFGILLRPCPCRDAQQDYSTSLPNITDVLFTDNALNLKPSRDNIFISKNQLLRKLRKFDEQGLVHLVLGCLGETGYGINICNCHTSVCFVLQSILQRGFRRGLTRGPSICSVDPDKCKGIDVCGKCLIRCPFHARTKRNGKGAVISERCYGCGLCANSCESSATQMIPRENYREKYFPSTWLSS